MKAGYINVAARSIEEANAVFSPDQPGVLDTQIVRQTPEGFWIVLHQVDSSFSATCHMCEQECRPSEGNWFLITVDLPTRGSVTICNNCLEREKREEDTPPDPVT